jgi:antitoxin (DNA-binding transcriptional repressor) of toxin-antitoxin stability system
MIRISVSELRARLSALLDIVRQGEDVVVIDRGRPVARLSLIRGTELEESRRGELLRSGRMRAPSASLSADFWQRRRPSDAKGRSLAALVEERGENR